jgi:hypothetical protein
MGRSPQPSPEDKHHATLGIKAWYSRKEYLSWALALREARDHRREDAPVGKQRGLLRLASRPLGGSIWDWPPDFAVAAL